ncbi:MAG: T9SS type A sorting domain-containing protein [bacterium]
MVITAVNGFIKQIPSQPCFPPTVVPEADDSMYVELHLDSSNVNNPPLIPSSELKGLYRITVLNRFGLSQFGADSLVLSDTVNITLFPEYNDDKYTLTFTSQDLSVYIPGEGWQTVDHEFQDYSFQREEIILRKWYNVAVSFQTNITSHYPFKRKEIKIFPNPFNSAIEIITPDKALINIYDSRGRLIERIKNQKWIPKSTLCSGIYFINIKYSNEVITRKVTYLK